MALYTLLLCNKNVKNYYCNLFFAILQKNLHKIKKVCYNKIV